MAKFLDLTGLQTVWAKVKDHVSKSISSAIEANVTSAKGKSNGLATLGSDGKLPTSQLPSLKTVNGNSLVGSGNIEIDLGVYLVVSTLPTTGQNPNKIYLVADAAGKENNVYKEYLWVDGKWELLGEYKAAVDLSPYMTKQEAITVGFLCPKLEYASNGYNIGHAYGSTDTLTIPNVSNHGPGLMTGTLLDKLNGITASATADSALTAAEIEAVLV